MPSLPSTMRDEEITEALGGRVAAVKLKLALEDLVRPHWFENSAERVRDVAVMMGDLAEFSEDVTAYAIREWRHNHDRRPTSAALRQICMVRRYELATELRRRSEPQAAPKEPPQAWRPATPEQLAERKAIFDRIATKAGFVRDKDGNITLPSEEAEPERQPHWSESAAPNDPRWVTLKLARKAAMKGTR